MFNFKQIKEYPTYGVSKDGRVMNLITKKILKPNLVSKLYPTIYLYDRHKKPKNCLIHRLVANAYIPNPGHLPQVNHKDGNKHNNNVDNLEWVTAKGNTNHAYNTGLISLNVYVSVYDKETGITTDYRSVNDAARALGTYHRLLIAYIKNSERYPFKGRYVIRVKDEERLINNLNSNNFGKMVYLYDLINKTHATYASMAIMSYYTGLKSFENITELTMNKLGYAMSYDYPTEKPTYVYSINDMVHNREMYLSQGYKAKVHNVAAIDLLDVDKGVLKFRSTAMFCKYLEDNFAYVIKVPKLLDIKYTLKKNTKLVCGHAFQLYGYECDIKPWDTYTLGEAYANRYGKRSNTPVYKIYISGVEHLVFGNYSMLKLLEPYIDNQRIFDYAISSIDAKCVQDAVAKHGIKIIKLNNITIKI